MNVRWLRQAGSLVATLDDATFRGVPGGLSPHRASAHLRHVIEFYECFLDGLDSLHVDYDARRRDTSLENSTLVAIARMESIIRRLEADPLLRGDSLMFVRVEDASALGLRDGYVTSSVGRELLTLSSHTIHHFALIAIVLRALGVTVGADFGVAPSTLRYQLRSLAA